MGDCLEFQDKLQITIFPLCLHHRWRVDCSQNVDGLFAQPLYADQTCTCGAPLHAIRLQLMWEVPEHPLPVWPNRSTGIGLPTLEPVKQGRWAVPVVDIEAISFIQYVCCLHRIGDGLVWRRDFSFALTSVKSEGTCGMWGLLKSSYIFRPNLALFVGLCVTNLSLPLNFQRLSSTVMHCGGTYTSPNCFWRSSTMRPSFHRRFSSLSAFHLQSGGRWKFDRSDFEACAWGKMAPRVDHP